MYKVPLALICVFVMVSCKEHPVSLSGNDKVEMKDFLAAFSKIALPYRVADTNMIKLADTTTISYAVFTQFIPDSVLINAFGKKAAKITIHPVGKIEKENELASNQPASPHYADQMELFVQQKTKPMTLNKAQVYKEAKRVYHPR